MNAHFDTLNQKIEPLREQIIQHALYHEINVAKRLDMS